MSAVEPEDPGMAAEYALGVLDAGERAAAERRRAADPAFAAEVRGWEDMLHPLSDAVASLAPSAALWPRIDGSVSTAEPRAAPVAPRAGGGWWSSVGFWRASTGALGALAAACLAVLVLRTPEPAQQVQPSAPPPMLVARIAAPQNGPAMLVVAYDPMRGMALVTPLHAAPTGRSHQLWLLDDQGTPHSLGVVRPDAPMPHRVPEAMAPMAHENAMLAISEEPAGGTATGAPTGPVVATGPLSRV